jgi:hypothetical protein
MEPASLFNITALDYFRYLPRLALIPDNRLQQRRSGDSLLKYLQARSLTRICPSRSRRDAVAARISASRKLCHLWVLILAGCGLVWAQTPAIRQVHLIEVLADNDSQYKLAEKHKPEIVVKAGEQILLRIRARKGNSWNRDGSVHGFALLRANDWSKVPGWDLLLKPGMQEFLMTAPDEVGEYLVVCTVVCSEDHEGMRMKFVVVP